MVRFFLSSLLVVRSALSRPSPASLPLRMLPGVERVDFKLKVGLENSLEVVVKDTPDEDSCDSLDTLKGAPDGFDLPKGIKDPLEGLEDL